MAARNQHVLDSAVVERRLRPIYEWLDSGNPKKALQEADKVLKKTSHLQCAKALKALSLLQLGREQESVSLLNQLTQETPSDNSTLQAMTICYRDLGQLEKVCNLYENAVQADATNEELHTHLFMSYVRTSNFQQQQKSAMVLFKMKPKNPYYFWAIMSIVLQATKGDGAVEPSKRTVLLSLAERMVEKLFKEDKLEAEQEVQLYLMILELQGKYDEALKVLDGPLGTKFMTGSTDLSRINYLTKLERWGDLNKLCNDLLTANMDRWDVWNNYLLSMCELTKSNAHVNNHVTENNDTDAEGVDDNPEKVHEFICSLIENVGGDNLFKNSSSYQLRGPYLARFELCLRLKNLGKDPTYLLGDTFELFVEYFRLFGHKPCCVSDLRIYLHLLDPQRRIELAGKLLKDVGIAATTVPQDEKQMQRHICALQLSRLCGLHANLEPEFLNALVQALLLHYETGARNFGVGKLPTDQGPADAYALLAAHSLYDLAVARKSSTPLVSALVLLEHVLKNSPSNFHAKLLCVRLYHTLGAAEGAQKMFELLDTKHLQMDSLGFVHCSRVNTTGLFTLAVVLYDATLKFFSTNYRDSIDHLTFSYKFGSFLKLQEFMDFRERLNNSLHYTQTAVDRMLLEMILCSNLKGLGSIDASPKNNNINWDHLRDNNDYGVYVSWDVDKDTHATTDLKLLFEQDKDLARIRSGLLCCVSSALDLLKTSSTTTSTATSSSTNDDNDAKRRETAAAALVTAHREWLTTCRNVEAKHYELKQMQRSISLPLVSRLNGYLQLPFKQIYDGFIQILLKLYCPNVNQENKHDESVTITTTTAAAAAASPANSEQHNNGIDALDTVLMKLANDVTKAINLQNTSADCLWDRRSTLEFVVGAVEILCISCVLCGVTNELLRPSQQSNSNKKAKKKSSTTSGTNISATNSNTSTTMPPTSTTTATGTTTTTNSHGTIRKHLTAAVTSLRKCCTIIGQELSAWHEPTIADDIIDKMNTLSVTDTTSATTTTPTSNNTESKTTNSQTTTTTNNCLINNDPEATLLLLQQQQQQEEQQQQKQKNTKHQEQMFVDAHARDTVLSYIRLSHNVAVKELRATLLNKIRYLNTIC